MLVPSGKGGHHRQQSASAPSSPLRYPPYSPSPLSSPAKSGESTPTQTTQANFDSTKSMPTMPSRIPIAKARYNMPMESVAGSITESIMSSEFSSTVDLEGTPSHSCFQDIDAATGNLTPQLIPIAPGAGPTNNSRSCDSPSMLYPSSDLAVKVPGKEHEKEDDSSNSSTTTQSFSTITIPSKVSVTAGSDDEMSHSSIISIPSRSSMKTSQFDFNDASKTKLSPQNSMVLEQLKPDCSDKVRIKYNY